MAGLDPAIHVFLREAAKNVDARHKAGHDGVCYRDSFSKRLTSRSRLRRDSRMIQNRPLS